MSFIGIISSNDVFDDIKNNINNSVLKKKLINIKKNDFKRINNRLDSIIINDNTDKLISDNLLMETKYLIINSDISIKDTTLKKRAMQIITYGMNQKSTITASSIKDDEVLICLQRNLEINNKKIEIQEFKKRVKTLNNKELYSLLVSFIIELLYN